MESLALEPESTDGAKADPFGNATIASLRLKPLTSLPLDAPCDEAAETMRDRAFDQLPVVTSSGKRLVGLLTLGNLLSYLGSGRASPSDPIEKVMFDFRAMEPVGVDPLLEGKEGETKGKRKHDRFVEITVDTPLRALSRFFEWNSAAIVTEKQANGGMNAVAVVTKVDLLSWLVREKARRS